MIKLHRINNFSNIKVGNIYSTNQNGYFKIIKILKNKYIIKFLSTGYIKTTKLSKIKSGVLKDKYKPIAFSIGYYGDLKTLDKKLSRELYCRWRNMLSRCYNENNAYYKLYGGNNVYVSDRWHNFSNFFEDVQLLNGWDRTRFMKKMITLDKDKLQQNSIKKVYSKDTCCWLSIKEQNEYIDFKSSHKHEMIPFAWEYNNKHGIALGITQFAKEHNLTIHSISLCINGTYSQHKGYKFRKCTDDELKLLYK